MLDPDRTTLGQALAQTAARFPDKTALIGAARSWTWSQLDRRVNQVARRYAALGVGQGDAVAVCTSKRPEVVISFLALARLGAVSAPVNFKLTASRIAYQFDKARFRALLLEPKLADAVAHVREQVGERVLHVDTAPEGAASWSEADALSDAPVDDSEIDPHSAVYYNYTSGTTGLPKAAVASHAHILWNSRSGVDGLGFGADEVFLGMFSVFSHPHELFNRCLVTGASFVILDTMSPRVVAQAVQEHGITWMMAVPSFYEMMLAHVGPDQFDVSSLRVLESGGAWVPPDTLQRLEGRFGCGFMPVWGSTETTGVALAMRPDLPRRAGSTGRVVALYEAGVFDDKGRPCADGQTGELWVKGPAVVRHYLDSPEETAAAFSDGWYHTSDLVRRDDDGWFHFMGRKSDMLKVGGIRVFPLEIEKVLRAHPEIAEAVVVRSEERVRGEIPRAILKVLQGSTLTRQDVLAWCREHLAVYKVPRIVEFWGTIPSLPNGKVDRVAVASAPASPNRDDRT